MGALSWVLQVESAQASLCLKARFLLLYIGLSKLSDTLVAKADGH
jgi:hypothetical protein